MAELIGIDETEFRGFIKSIPNLWNDSKKMFTPGIDLLLNNFVDSEHFLSSTHVFTIGTGFIVLLTEYLKEIGAATFKIHVYQPWFGSFSVDETFEIRFMNMIMKFSDKDMASFRELVTMKIFVCPICHAQYSFRVLVIGDDGLIQCQNCGKFVHVAEPHIESETQFEESEEDEAEHQP